MLNFKKKYLTSVIILVSVVVNLLFTLFIYRNYIAEKPSNLGLETKFCASTGFLLDQNLNTDKPIAPVLDSLGDYSFNVSTKNKKAQYFINQGFRLLNTFNHAEAHRSFMEANRIDPQLAMGYWGQAYALGPNINDSKISKERKRLAYKAIKLAKKHSKNSSHKEVLLIDALSKRFSKRNPNLKKTNITYMNMMHKVLDEFPEDVDILTLYAASVMNTNPWNYWKNDGEPAENILKAKKTLEKALKINPKHPAANHYYIHLVEYLFPNLGIKSAIELEKSDIKAGHLLHMPSHIYMRIGDYYNAVRVNKKAILADEKYISQCYSQGKYPLKYYPHNIHFLWSSSSMMGNSKLAISASKKINEKIPHYELKKSPDLQTFSASTILSYLRFGKWNEILTMPNPGNDYELMKLYYHYARGIAFLRKNNLQEALEELSYVNIDDNIAFPIRAKLVFEILNGEIEAYKGNINKAVTHLEKAVALEDTFGYREPPTWYIPTRQTLATILLKARKFKEAEHVLTEDLDYYPNNIWSLQGLHQSFINQNEIEKADSLNLYIKKASENIDLKITKPVF